MPEQGLRQLYDSELHPGIDAWPVAEFLGAIPGRDEIRYEARGRSQFAGITIEKYVIHHSRYLELPLLYLHRTDGPPRPILLWLGENGKAGVDDWPALQKHLDAGYDIVSVDPRGLGETRMPYKAASPDDPSLANLDFERAYVSPISGVLADYVYNSILTGRPYFLQVIEDVEIAARFSRAKINPNPTILITGADGARRLASAASDVLSNVSLLSPADRQNVEWSEWVDQKTELWPIQYLLPGGAYMH